MVPPTREQQGFKVRLPLHDNDNNDNNSLQLPADAEGAGREACEEEEEEETLERKKEIVADTPPSTPPHARMEDIFAAVEARAARGAEEVEKAHASATREVVSAAVGRWLMPRLRRRRLCERCNARPMQRPESRWR